MKDFGTRAKLVIVLFALTTLLGCGALDAGTPMAQSNNGLVATSAVVDFGTVPVGTTQVRTNTIVNTSKSPIVLTRAQIDQTEFTITGQKLPLTLAPGQRTVLQICIYATKRRRFSKQTRTHQQHASLVHHLHFERHRGSEGPAHGESLQRKFRERTDRQNSNSIGYRIEPR